MEGDLGSFPSVCPVNHALTAPTPTSPNAAAVLDVAIACARPSPIDSEHVLFALFNVEGYSPQIMSWMGSVSMAAWPGTPTGEDNTPEMAYRWFRTRVLSALDRKGFRPSPWEDVPRKWTGAGLTLTLAMERIMKITHQISQHDVGHNADVDEDGLITPEFIVAAIMVDGTSQAFDIIYRCTRGLVNCWSLLETINVDPRPIFPPRGRLTFNTEVVNRGAAGRSGMLPWEPTGQLPDLEDGKWCAAPLKYANWLIPNHLMIGETIGRDSWNSAQSPNDNTFKVKRDLSRLVPAFVDTFVALRAEWGPMPNFLSMYYPEEIRSQGLDADVLFCPLETFRVEEEYGLATLIVELRKRLRRGERLYMHCNSGHGRVGMVSIPLIACLYDLSAEEATDFVQRAHDLGRNGGRDAGWSLPETDEQREVVQNLIEFMKRSGDDDDYDAHSDASSNSSGSSRPSSLRPSQAAECTIS